MLAETHRSVVPLAGNLSIKDNLHQLLWEVGRGNEKINLFESEGILISVKTMLCAVLGRELVLTIRGEQRL